MLLLVLQIDFLKIIFKKVRGEWNYSLQMISCKVSGFFYLTNLHFDSCSAHRVASSSLLVGKKGDELTKSQVIKQARIK